MSEHGDPEYVEFFDELRDALANESLRPLIIHTSGGTVYTVDEGTDCYLFLGVLAIIRYKQGKVLIPSHQISSVEVNEK